MKIKNVFYAFGAVAALGLQASGVSAQGLSSYKTIKLQAEAEPLSRGAIGPAGNVDSIIELPRIGLYRYAADPAASLGQTVFLRPKTEVASITYNIDQVVRTAKEKGTGPIDLRVRYAAGDLRLENPWPILEFRLNGKKIYHGKGRLPDLSFERPTRDEQNASNVFYDNAELKLPRNRLKEKGNILEVKALPMVRDFGKLHTIEVVHFDKMTFTIKERNKQVKPKPPAAQPPAKPSDKKHTISVTLKADAYKGPANYVINAAGKKLAAGSVGAKAKTLTYHVDTLPQVLSIFFTNDLYEGRGKDRNLRILKVSVDGKPVTLSKNMIDACKWSRVVNKTIVLACGDKRMFDGVFIPLK